MNKGQCAAAVVGLAFGLIALMVGGGCVKPQGTIEMTSVPAIPWEKNLLLKEGVTLTASSHNEESEGVEKLLDNDPNTFWHVDVSMMGLPAWVEADFGEGKAVVVSSFAARPRIDPAGSEHGAQQFFRNVQIQASHDGVNWAPLAWARQLRAPEERTWFRCDFKNREAFRFWRLLIIDGHLKDNRYFLSMADLALF